MDHDPGELEARLHALRRDYLARLPEKLAAIERGWQRLSKAWEPPGLAAIHRQAHGLVGSGESFGFPAISRTARALEQRLAGLIAGSGPPTPAERDGVHLAIAGLGRAIAAAIADPTSR